MGHYAAEVSPDWMKHDAELAARRKAGFSYYNVSEMHSDGSICDVCSALILEWRKHRKVCKMKRKKAA